MKPPDEVHIRLATLADFADIMRHRREMFRDMGYTNDAVLDAMEQTSGKYIERGLREDSYKGWLAVVNGKTIGGAGILVHDWVSHPQAPEQSRRAYLLNVYTEPEYRRAGIARRLTEAAIAWCRSEGFKTLWLHASDQGRSIYAALGFEPTNEMKLVIR